MGLVVPLAVLGGAMPALAATPYAVTATVPVGILPGAVAVNKKTDTVYVANANSDTVSVITGSDTVSVIRTGTLTR